MDIFSALVSPRVEYPHGPGEFPEQNPMMRSLSIFFIAKLKKKNPKNWTTSRAVGDLNRHRHSCDVIVIWTGWCGVLFGYKASHFCPHPLGLVHWHWGYQTIASASVALLLRIWANGSHSQERKGHKVDRLVRRQTQIARFTGPTWAPPGSCRPQMGPMLSPWT